MFFKAWRAKRLLRTAIKLQNKSIRMNFDIYSIISTWFGIGLLPFAPGTLASISVYPIYKYIFTSLESYSAAMFVLWVVIFFLTVFGWLCIGKFELRTMTHDHSSVVIDEVVGQLLVFALAYDALYQFAISLNTYIKLDVIDIIFILGLITFRYFDIQKPFIIKTIDRKVKGAFGVLLDDVVAAAFGAFTIHIIYQAYSAIF